MPETNDTNPAEVVGRFGTAEGARAAMVRLERSGIDAERITLKLGEGGSDVVSTREEVRTADEEAVGDVASSAGATAGLGAVAGAAAGVVTGLVTGDVGLGATVGSTAAVGGGVVGGLMGTYKDLPANPQAFETYEIGEGTQGPVEVVVRVDSVEQAEAVKATLLDR